MAPGLGIDFLDKDLKTRLDIPRDVFYNYEDVSAVGLLMKLFSQTGTSTWVISSYSKRAATYSLCLDLLTNPTLA
jgi:hypothetical protein